MTGWTRYIFAAVGAYLSISCCDALAENRVALVIGNSTYRSVPTLANPAIDAKAFAESLSAANFEVVWGVDVAQIDMRRAIREFSSKVAAKGADTTALLFYSGYGIQVDGENFLIPIDARIERESDVAVEALRLTDVINAIGASPSNSRIIIIDAAYGNPFAQFNQASGKGLAMVDVPTATLVAFSAAPGTEGTNRPFTATLINASKIPGVSIDDALGLVRIAMFEAGNGNQMSWESSRLTRGFSLFPGAVPIAAPDLAAKPVEFWRNEVQSRQPTEAFRFILGKDTAIGYEELFRIYPQTPFAPQLRSLLNRRQEMIAWQAASKTNSVASFESFITRYSTSDLVANAGRLLERARTSGSQTSAVVTPPMTTPAIAKTEKASVRKRDDDDEEETTRSRRKKKAAQVRRHEQSVRDPAPPAQSSSPVILNFGGIGFGIGR